MLNAALKYCTVPGKDGLCSTPSCHFHPWRLIRMGRVLTNMTPSSSSKTQQYSTVLHAVPCNARFSMPDRPHIVRLHMTKSCCPTYNKLSLALEAPNPAFSDSARAPSYTVTVRIQNLQIHRLSSSDEKATWLLICTRCSSLDDAVNRGSLQIILGVRTPYCTVTCIHIAYTAQPRSNARITPRLASV